MGHCCCICLRVNKLKVFFVNLKKKKYSDRQKKQKIEVSKRYPGFYHISFKWS